MKLSQYPGFNCFQHRSTKIIYCVIVLACLTCGCITKYSVVEEKDVAVSMVYNGKQGYWISKEKFEILAEKAIKFDDYTKKNSESQSTKLLQSVSNSKEVVKPIENKEEKVVK